MFVLELLNSFLLFKKNILFTSIEMKKKCSFIAFTVTFDRVYFYSFAHICVFIHLPYGLSFFNHMLDFFFVIFSHA